jgi:adenosylcobinamide-phosphate synthase
MKRHRAARAGGMTAALVGGALLDSRLRDPPNRWHPVAAIGRLVHKLEVRAPSDPAARRRYGMLVAALLPEACGAIALATTATAGRAPGGRYAAEAALLALATSQRTLLDRAIEVAEALERDELEEARRLLAWHLVSRDTSTLDASGVAGAAIESVAENLSDGVVGAWWWFAIGGAPGAWGYRATNTLDAMWGYRNPPYEELGMPAARLDDALNLVPARLTALAILAAARGEGAGAWWRDRGRTESPNAGHPMAAMAGALSVELGKDGHYLLGAEGREANAGDIHRAVSIARHAAWIALVPLTALTAWRWLR